jgi:hypothetical protein
MWERESKIDIYVECGSKTCDMRMTADAIRRAEGIIECTVHVTQRKVAVRPERAMHYAKECYVGGGYGVRRAGGGGLSPAARSRGTFRGGAGGGGETAGPGGARHVT